MTGYFIFIFRHVVCLWWLHSWWPGQSAGWWLCILCPECLKSAQSWILTRGQLISDRLNVACTFAWLCLPWFLVNVEYPEFCSTWHCSCTGWLTAQHRKELWVETVSFRFSWCLHILVHYSSVTLTSFILPTFHSYFTWRCKQTTGIIEETFLGCVYSRIPNLTVKKLLK